MSPGADGQAPAGYEAAVRALAVAARPDRAAIRVTGRDPVAMLQGVLTHRVPDAASATAAGARGAAHYAAVLTPKGKMVADLRVVRGPRPADATLLLDAPAAAVGGLLEHLARYLPPRLARAADARAEIGHLTLAGPSAAAWLARDALGLRAETADVEGLAEDEWIWLDGGGAGVLVLASRDLATPAFEVLSDPDTAAALERMARDAGAVPLSSAALEALRIEAGRPAWGRELDADTLPPEAGIEARAIDPSKGCYTGQEVIVRIRDRGHVNRRLRGLALAGGEAAGAPAPGAELWAPGRERPVGSITSAAFSPRAGRPLALAYVRREVEIPGVVRVGSPDGAEARVLELGEGWWRG